MSLRARKTAISGMTLVAVASSGLLLIFALQRLVQTEAEVAGRFGESLLWFLYQAQHEEQRLISGVLEWNNSERTEEDAEQLRLLADLAVSRLDVFSQGTLARAAANANESAVIDDARVNLLAVDQVLQAAILQRSTVPKSELDALRSDVS